MVEQPAGSRLSDEGSSFLRGHAADRVAWYPWGEEALQDARVSGKPIFLSIGYSTCHWCRMMAQEAFNRPEVAKLLNESFVNVLVDREQLPQVDALYTRLAQVMNAETGGWPLNLFLTPELAPFFASTYMPADTKKGLLGLTPVIARVRQLWEHAEEREQLIGQADELLEVFRQEIEGVDEEEKEELEDGPEYLANSEAISQAAELLFHNADPVYGGTIGSPKFPIPTQLSFLLRLSHDSTESRALFVIELTLDSMARGGICDQLGGGFSHYTLDARWRLPHFEKMLNDNALLATTYLEAWQVTHRQQFRDVCRATLDFLLHELRHPEGGFFCAQDAETEKGASKQSSQELPAGAELLPGADYYIWTAEEIHRLLGPDEGSLFSAYYDIGSQPPERPHILHAPVSMQAFAEQRELSLQDVARRLEKSRALLLEARRKRPAPRRDEKIVVCWNGLAIHALASAGLALQMPEYLEAAQRAATFLKDNFWLEGELVRCWYDGLAQVPATLNDYACLIHGLLSLFEAGAGSHWLRWALELTRSVEQLFGGDGAFYMTRSEELRLPVRLIEWVDDGEPSGNGVHGLNLMRLHRLTGQVGYRERAEALLLSGISILEETGVAAASALTALQSYRGKKAALIVIALPPDERERALIEGILTREFLPYVSYVWRSSKDAELLELLPHLADKEPLEGKTTIYIQTAQGWEEPITELDLLRERIHKL